MEENIEKIRRLDQKQLALVKELVKVMAEKKHVLDAQAKVVEIRKARAAGSAELRGG